MGNVSLSVLEKSLNCLFKPWITLARLERFSFECRKVIGFALSTRCDWLKIFAPPFHPIRSKTKANCDALACIFPRFASATFNYFEFLLVQCIVCPMWLARVITLVLVLRHSNENHSDMQGCKYTEFWRLTTRNSKLYTFWSQGSLLKEPTFRDATSSYPAKWRLSNECTWEIPHRWCVTTQI